MLPIVVNSSDLIHNPDFRTLLTLHAMFGFAMRGLVVIVVLLVAVSAMRHEPFRPLPTAPMPAVNVP
jgi:hypothetical protein